MRNDRSTSEMQVRPYRAEDEEQLLAVLSASLGGGPAGPWSSTFLRWKHLENPFGASLMLVAEMAGRIVGLRAFLRWRFRAADRTMTALRAVDTATHPDYHRRGIFSQLTREALIVARDQADLVFNTPNEKSLPGYLKLGWGVVGRVPVMLRIRRPIRVLKGIRLIGGTQATAGVPSVVAPPAAEVLAQVGRLARLLEGDETQPRWHTPRDEAYLRWRYGTGTSLDYRAIVEDGSDGIEGLGIFRVRQRRGMWESVVAELLVPTGDRSMARRILRRIVKAAPVDYVVGSMVTEAATPAARRTGFIHSPRGITLVANPLRDGLEPNPLSLGSWAVTLGDLEVF
jgi:GNAT superfamily N-acetyltransferase